MPFVFEQPNLDRQVRAASTSTRRRRLSPSSQEPERRTHPSTDTSAVHIAFSVSQATFNQAVARLDERGIHHSGVKDRGFMDSIYFTDPLGLLIELASYRFEPPAGFSHSEVLLEAHKLRTERGDHHIDQEHLADAIEALVTRSRDSLSEDRTPKDPYTH
jgi:catechol-2,3-dioxygenase